jgi:multidrug efflux pump subunit AcrB
VWIVRLALRRPYTVATLCLVIAALGGLSLTKLRTDILPAIDIPVVVVVWSYPGLVAEEMEKRVITLTERAFSTSVGDIQKLESQSINGIGIVKVYFQQGTDIGGAIAQISAVSNTVLRGMPPGITAPVILQFNASNVPVAQLTLAGEGGASEQQLFDYGLNFLRLRLFTVPGLATPAPYGGRQREVVVDIDPAKLAAQGLSPQDVVDAISRNNVILPAGTARIGEREWDVRMNSSPLQIEQFNEIPIRTVGNRLVLMRDVAHVHDGYATQNNVVRVDGRRATYLNILKKADASTLTVVDTVREMLPTLQKSAPNGVELKLEFDQSEFVRAAVHEVLREGLLAAALVSLMILFFLGSWRSMLIVCSSIPIAIVTSIVGLFLCSQTLNLMTLGGLALAIGMLVDDATVEVENIHRNRAMEKGLTRAILDGAHQIAVPALAATLTICIVFFPVVLLTGASKYLFTPLALAVVFAMLASYLLSRTLVPTLARMLLEKDKLHEKGNSRAHRFNEWRDRHFDRLRDKYAAALQTALEHGKLVFAAMALLVVCAGALAFGVGLDFFPTVDTGMMRLHYRAPIGTRIESTELYLDRVEKEIRKIVPQQEIASITDNIGVPISYNLAFVQSDNSAGNDAEIRIQLGKKHKPTAEYQDKLREALPKDFPGSTFYFLSADIVSQVLNFGLASAIDVEVLARNKPEEQRLAVQKVFAAVQAVPGTADVHVAQQLDHPALQVNVDRQQAAALNIAERDVANSLLTSLSSSQLVAPSFWADPKTGVNYNVIVQTPLQRVSTVDDLYATPVTPQGGTQGTTGPVSAPFLGSLAQIQTSQDKAAIAHDTVQPVVEVQANVAHRDLGATASDVQAAVDKLDLPDGVTVKVRGQAESMNAAFGNMGLGMLLALGLVYLLLVILFQSWLDPLIIAVAVPGALIGVLWMLAITGTTLNVESMMGAIMAIGIATSNSILLVSFANDRRAEAPELSPMQAMLDAGRTRLRPVMMTALAMILGMLPMALGLGEGGEQNAPLGRAVIGGLLVATFVTLFFVPVTYAALRKKMPRKQELEDRFRKEEAEGVGASEAPAHA